MAKQDSHDIYRRLGVRGSINAVGTGTLVGGSGPPLHVREAMEAASHRFVRMHDLLVSTGELVAELLGTEAAYITSGGAAALTLGTAACIAGDDPEKIEMLPDTTGMKNEVVVQKKHLRTYDRCLRAAGARLVDAGDETGCTREQLEAAFGPSTAAVFQAWPPFGDMTGLYDDAPREGENVPLDEVVEIAHGHDVPVIVDGAAEVYPLDFFQQVAQAGDLTSFGGKYVGGPNASGILCGRKDLVQAAMAHGFTTPTGAVGIGRAMKSDRQQIVALATALETWLRDTNFEDRFIELDRMLSVVENALKPVPNVRMEATMISHGFYGSYLMIYLDPAVGKTAPQLVDELYDGEPSVLVRAATDDSIRLFFYTLDEGDEELVARRLVEVLGG
jgi:L-seryl-tRNA(Ser) seleniumtransferase